MGTQLLAQSLIPMVDMLRAYPALFGLRAYTVKIRLRLWNGERPGIAGSAYTDTDSVVGNSITIGNKTTIYPPRFEQLSQKDIIASGGLYTDHDFKVGPLSPAYSKGGVLLGLIDPPPFNAAAEILWLVFGPDLPTTGVEYRRIGEEATALHFYVILRATGKVP